MRGAGIKVIGAVKTFGGLRALDGVDVEIRPATISLLVGPNGSGKTTLINVISGVLKPDAGKILLNDRDITGLHPHEIYRAGVLRTWQIPQPFLRMSVLENVLVADGSHPGEGPISFILRRTRWIRYEEESVRRAYEFLRQVRLDHLWDAEASKLSGGQMKLLEIARALMSGAKVLLLDEPAAGVNPALAEEIFANLVRIKEGLGVTILIVEHRLEIAMKYTDWCYAMFGGKVIAEGKPEAVLADTRVIESYLGG
ncbi:MAG: ABC transporter ATP-binding protein [Thaumarchaeota archaeon]|nr:ABC transporter ATP-binding protein [Candidatus Calditenuaceae archaeon]MDW8187610.1 ABC transporter ATP-binding protein [Nitrososphaerota archaeon]